MDILSRLETAIDALLEKNQKLKVENAELRQNLELLSQERTYLVDEVDRILKRLEDI